MDQRWHFTIAWIVWIVAFFIIEAWAIWGPAPDATLSNHIRQFFKSNPWWIQIGGWAVMVWLTLHFMLDLKPEGRDLLPRLYNWVKGVGE